MNRLTTKQRKKAHAIIHSASTAAASAGAGFAQIPASDSAVIVPIQIAMVISLGSIFGIELSKSSAKATLAAATATLIGRGLSQLLAGWIPVLGNAMNAATAAGVTETIGWAVVNDFENQAKKAKETHKKK